MAAIGGDGFRDQCRQLGLRAKHFIGVCEEVGAAMSDASGECGAGAVEIVSAALQAVAKEVAGVPVPGLHACVGLVAQIVTSLEKVSISKLCWQQQSRGGARRTRRSA